MKTAAISEIFSTRQGEGPHAGQKQIFLRLAGCPLRCRYCDTLDSLTAQGHPLMSVSDVVDEIMKISRRDSIDTVSVTGGEPLSHVSFLEDVFPLLKKEHVNIYLESAGVHPAELRRVVEWCDVIAMDIKLPSATGKAYWLEHKEFLEVSQGKAFVKIVIEKESAFDEFMTAVSLVRSCAPVPLLVIQPVTPQLPLVEEPDPSQVNKFFAEASTLLSKVLVVRQKHKEWGIR